MASFLLVVVGMIYYTTPADGQVTGMGVRVGDTLPKDICGYQLRANDATNKN